VKEVHRLLDWGEQHGVAVVLVDMPVPADLDERLFPREFAAYRAFLVELEQSRGVRVLRPTRAALGLTDAHFADLVHLNGHGKARLSVWLRRTLSDLSMSDDLASRLVYPGGPAPAGVKPAARRSIQE
jgi:hypothetical protein